MYTNKKVLLIAGGGTLGTHVSNELLQLGCSVDIICPEEKISDHKNLRFFRNYATFDVLTDLFQNTHYDGIVNFLHFENPSDYKPMHRLLIQNTDHLIFLSSYRVYADLEHPITESSPRLLDTSTDQEFLNTETYAVSKAKCEDFLRTECVGEPWTIVRPVISFSHRRFDLFTYSDADILERIDCLLLPEFARNLGAGIDWAGNSGKLIAHLLFKPACYGEAYTISSGQNLTWEEVAVLYQQLLGARIQWVDEQSFIDNYPCLNEYKKYLYLYDRKFDRTIDNSKVLKAAGLSLSDFCSIGEGLKKELALRKSTE